MVQHVRSARAHLDKELPKLGVEYTSLSIKKLLGKNAETIVKAAKKMGNPYRQRKNTQHDDQALQNSI